MALNKKGIFFSLTALLIVGVIFVALNTPPPRESSTSAFLRVQDITEDRDFLLKHNLPLILREYAMHSVNQIAKDQISGGTSATNKNDVNNLLRDCLNTSNAPTGNKCGTQTLSTATRTFQKDIKKIELLYYYNKQYGINIILQDAQLTQVSTWELLVTGTFHLTLQDLASIAQYDSTVTVSTLIPIEGLIDPLPSASTPRPRRITTPQFANTLGVIDWNPDNVMTHARQGSYIEDTTAPSYLQRLYGDTTASPFGIHSLMPPDTYSGSLNSYIDYDSSINIDGGTGQPCMVGVHLAASNAFGEELYLTPYWAFQYNISTGPAYVTAGCPRGAIVTP